MPSGFSASGPWAFQLLAVVPLMQGGVVHLDVYRQPAAQTSRSKYWIALAPPLGSLIAVVRWRFLFE